MLRGQQAGEVSAESVAMMLRCLLHGWGDAAFGKQLRVARPAAFALRSSFLSSFSAVDAFQQQVMPDTVSFWGWTLQKIIATCSCWPSSKCKAQPVWTH